MTALASSGVLLVATDYAAHPRKAALSLSDILSCDSLRRSPVFQQAHLPPLATVRAENPVHGPDQQSCSPGRPGVMIIGHVPAACFLLITRIAAWLRLPRREEAWKTAEILLLRHQLTVLQRRQPRRPKLNWADRALIATLLSVIPKARRHGLRLLVAPETILRWHRDIVRRHWAARSMRGKTGRPATRRNIKALVRRLARKLPAADTAGSTANWRVWASKSQRRPWEILKASGIDPARRQAGPTWSQFLRSQAGAILASDFFTADLLDGTQAYVLAESNTPAGASASSESPSTHRGVDHAAGATFSWTSANRRTGPSS
jgi:hypothetical protein